MPSALILIADGTEEIEFVTPYDVLTRAGFKVKSAGVSLQHDWANCSRNVKITPDYPSLHPIAADSNSSHTDADILIIPGGADGAKTMASNKEVQQLIQRFRKEGKWIGLICAGTTALVAASEKADVTVTSHPSVKDDITGKGWKYSEERVVVDGKVITSRGPGTAMRFALTIVEELAGKEKMEEVSGPMLVADELVHRVLDQHA